ncbi:MAG: hypothetical protein ACRDG3_10650 [Tepidiformaceae bacterium]
MTIAGTLSSTLQHPIDSVRYAAERFLIVPAADHLPLRMALWLAGLVAFCDCLIPSGGWRSTRAEVHAAGAPGIRPFAEIGSERRWDARAKAWG